MFDISRQAYFYMSIWIVTSVINMIATAYLFGASGLLSYIVSSIIMLPVLLLYLYNIDCLTYGNCETWSWIITIVMSIGLIFFTLSMLYLALFKSSFQAAFGPIDVEPTVKDVKDVKDDSKK